MNPIILPSSLVLQLPSRHLSTRCQLLSQYSSTTIVRHRVHFNSPVYRSFASNSCCSLRTRQLVIGATVSSNDEGPVSVINFEDFIEKDWSFPDLDDVNSKEHKQNIGKIISAGGIEEASRVLVSIGSE